MDKITSPCRDGLSPLSLVRSQVGGCHFRVEGLMAVVCGLGIATLCVLCYRGRYAGKFLGCQVVWRNEGKVSQVIFVHGR